MYISPTSPYISRYLDVTSRARSGCASLYTVHAGSRGHQTRALHGTCLGRVGVRVRVRVRVPVRVLG